MFGGGQSCRRGGLGDGSPVRGIRNHPRDVQIVDMRNRGLSAAEIADALGTTEGVIRDDFKRETIGLAETGDRRSVKRG